MVLLSIKKFIATNALLFTVCVFSLFIYILNFSPKDTAPMGPLLVFFLIYLSIVFLTSIIKSLSFFRRGKDLKPGNVLLKSAVLGLLPVMLIALVSIGQIGTFDIILVVLLFLLLNFYFKGD